MKNALLIDLGGTNVRHAFFINNALSKISKEKISDKEFIPFITKLLNEAESKIEYLVVAAAGPNNEGFINLTNRNLLINSSELEATLNLKKCLLLNDWEAVAFSLSEMKKKSFLSIKGNVPSNKNTLLIGPGTGLGVTLIIDDQIIPTEFGNVLSATKSMMESFGIERSEKFLSLENILSGPGIEMLYEEKFGKKLSSEKIITLALERNEDALFIVNNFLKILITIIDDLVLSFTCKRVILGGAILNSLKSILTSEEILNYFSSRINPKYSQLIEEVQVDLLLEDEPGIYGCLAFLKAK
ncbi:glucokinase [Gammaproteobacteria bacterium]|nr:glucokinase [Gammaproteobacteria bacterium]